MGKGGVLALWHPSCVDLNQRLLTEAKAWFAHFKLSKNMLQFFAGQAGRFGQRKTSQVVELDG
jgi:hypothetical protein